MNYRCLGKTGLLVLWVPDQKAVDACWAYGTAFVHALAKENAE